MDTNVLFLIESVLQVALALSVFFLLTVLNKIFEYFIGDYGRGFLSLLMGIAVIIFVAGYGFIIIAILQTI